MSYKRRRLVENYSAEEELRFEQLFLEFLNKNPYLYTTKIDDRHFETLIDVDFTLDKETLTDVLDSLNPEEHLDLILDQLNLWENIRPEYEYVYDEFLYYLKREDIDRDSLQDWFWDFVYDFLDIQYNTDQLYEQEFKAMLVINNGDLAYDFSLNPNSDNKFKVVENSGIAWLAETQGIELDTLQKALQDGPKQKTGNKTLDSIVEECYDVLSSMNAVTFLGSTTLGDAIKVAKGKASVSVTTKAYCGLFDSWNGCGSDFAIDLSNQINNIPSTKVWYFGIDGGAGGYSTEDVYGFISKVYSAEAFIVSDKNGDR